MYSLSWFDSTDGSISVKISPFFFHHLTSNYGIIWNAFELSRACDFWNWIPFRIWDKKHVKFDQAISNEWHLTCNKMD